MSEAEKDEMTARLGDIQKKLIDMEAETGPARAAQLLVGLGFEVEDQEKPTRSFSGGWRSVAPSQHSPRVERVRSDNPPIVLDQDAVGAGASSLRKARSAHAR